MLDFDHENNQPVIPANFSDEASEEPSSIPVTPQDHVPPLEVTEASPRDQVNDDPMDGPAVVKPPNPLVEAMRKFESPRRRSIKEAVTKTLGKIVFEKPKSWFVICRPRRTTKIRAPFWYSKNYQVFNEGTKNSYMFTLNSRLEIYILLRLTACDLLNI